VSLPGFTLRESGTAFEIDVDGDKVVYGTADSGQLHLNEVANRTPTSMIWCAGSTANAGMSTWASRNCIKWLLALVLSPDRRPQDFR
jgi:type III restriction enzyme